MITLEAQLAREKHYEDVISFQLENRDPVHVNSFLIARKGGFVIVNDFAAASFEKRMKMCLRNEVVPISLVHRKKRLSAAELVDFVQTFSERMTKRGKRPSVRFETRDLEFVLAD